MYELVNNLTNRRPVRITENDSIFGNFDSMPTDREDRLYTSSNNKNQNEVLFVKSNNNKNNKSNNIRRHAVQIKEDQNKEVRMIEPENTVMSVASNANNKEEAKESNHQPIKHQPSAIIEDSENVLNKNDENELVDYKVCYI
jgi:hypothetical protein